MPLKSVVMPKNEPSPCEPGFLKSYALFVSAQCIRMNIVTFRVSAGTKEDAASRNRGKQAVTMQRAVESHAPRENCPPGTH